jgi:hypothetical protein
VACEGQCATRQYDRLLEGTAISIAAARATLPAAERRLKEHLKATVGFAKLESVMRREMKDLLDYASAPARLSACTAQLQGRCGLIQIRFNVHAVLPTASWRCPLSTSRAQ